MSEIFLTIYVIGAILLLFGAAVFVHEFGHYWVARMRGMKVEEFAIGFGPKAFSWVRNGIAYSWRWIPAGGFVKLPQMITSESFEGKVDSENLPPASPLSKILVAVAGPVMNVIFAFVLATIIYFVGLPRLVNPSIIGFVEPDSAEAQLGIQPGDRIVEIAGDKVSSWQDVHLKTIFARTNVLPVVIERGGERSSYQLTAITNPAMGWKMLNLFPRDQPTVMTVLENSAAEEAGLQRGDTVVSFAGVPIASITELIGLIEKRASQPTEMKIKRAGEMMDITITPKEVAQDKGQIGVELGDAKTAVYQVEHPTPWAQVVDVWDKTIKTLVALFFPKETGVGIKHLSGPVGIFAVLGSQVKADFRLALSFLVLLNINLAILNMLPVPVLDGGHILMAIIEKIRGRPMSVRFVEYTTTGFAVLLLGLFLYITVFDVKRLPYFKALYETEVEMDTSGTDSSEPAPAQ